MVTNGGSNGFGVGLVAGILLLLVVVIGALFLFLGGGTARTVAWRRLTTSNSMSRWRTPPVTAVTAAVAEVATATAPTAP